MFWFFGHRACGISAPQPEVKPAPLLWTMRSEPLDHQGSPKDSFRFYKILQTEYSLIQTPHHIPIIINILH